MLIPTARGNERWLERIALELEKLPGAQASRANPLTGSIVLRYEEPPGGIVGPLAELGRSQRLFELVRGARTRPGGARPRAKPMTVRGSQLGRELVTFGRILNREMKLATDGLLDLRLLMPLAAAAASAATGARRPSQGTPPWFNLLVFAFDSFVAFHRGVPLEVDVFGERAHVILGGAQA
jgi:hypothetical protein